MLQCKFNQIMYGTEQFCRAIVFLAPETYNSIRHTINRAKEHSSLQLKFKHQFKSDEWADGLPTVRIWSPALIKSPPGRVRVTDFASSASRQRGNRPVEPRNERAHHRWKSCNKILLQGGSFWEKYLLFFYARLLVGPFGRDKEAATHWVFSMTSD